MSTIAEFALSQGIPVVKRNGEDCIRVSEETFAYLSHRHEPVLVALACSCAQRPYPHDLKAHSKLFEAPGGYWVWNPGGEDVFVRFSGEEMRWPWSLRWVMDDERQFLERMREAA